MNAWNDLHALVKPKPQKAPARGTLTAWSCGHPKTPENSVGRKQLRCRICKRIASEEFRKKNPGYYKRWYRAHKDEMALYQKHYRAIKTVEFSK